MRIERKKRGRGVGGKESKGRIILRNENMEGIRERERGMSWREKK